jgi:hypothetical protein
MTSTCPEAIPQIVSDLQGVSEVAVNFLGKCHHEFEARVMTVEPLGVLDYGSTTGPRMFSLCINDMFCHCYATANRVPTLHLRLCPENVITAVKYLHPQFKRIAVAIAPAVVCLHGIALAAPIALLVGLTYPSSRHFKIDITND